jgi:hypothetical protein
MYCLLSLQGQQMALLQLDVLLVGPVPGILWHHPESSSSSTNQNNSRHDYHLHFPLFQMYSFVLILN